MLLVDLRKFYETEKILDLNPLNPEKSDKSVNLSSFGKIYFKSKFNGGLPKLNEITESSMIY